jgi:hypothetical protein
VSDRSASARAREKHRPQAGATLTRAPRPDSVSRDA